MRLITFNTIEGARHIGVALPDEAAVVDLTAAADVPYFADMLALIDGGNPALDHARGL